MKISEEDALRILNPELRDPELERRRLETIERSGWLRGLVTPENLARGIPFSLPPRRVKR